MLQEQGTAERGSPCASRDRATREQTWSDVELSTTVVAAANGDPQAWEGLVRRFSNMIMACARSCRLNDADVAEVHQVTWLRLVEHIGRIEHPERVGSWLMTTAKRESVRVARGRNRLTLDHDALVQWPDDDAKPPDAGPIAEEQYELLREAYAQLPAHCQRLMGILAVGDPPSYKEISRMLSMPIGSIGPTRGRCLEHLRRILEKIEGGRSVTASERSRPLPHATSPF